MKNKKNINKQERQLYTLKILENKLAEALLDPQGEQSKIIKYKHDIRILKQKMNLINENW